MIKKTNLNQGLIPPSDAVNQDLKDIEVLKLSYVFRESKFL